MCAHQSGLRIRQTAIAFACVLFGIIGVIQGADFYWLGGNGRFEDPLYWSGPTMGPPGPDDTAHFETFGSYVVSFGSRVSNQSAIVTDADFTFEMDPLLEPNYVLDTISITPSWYGGRLAIRNGPVQTGYALVSGTAPAQLDVLLGGGLRTGDLSLGQSAAEVGSCLVEDLLVVDHLLIVGDYGDASIILDGTAGPARVLNDPAFTGITLIAAQPGSTGNVSISGMGALWRSNSLYIGGNDLAAGGVGTLTVDNGGQLAVSGPIVVWDAGSLNSFAGSIQAASIALQPGGSFAWAGGSLELTDSDLTIGATGLFGPTLAVNAGDDISISGSTAVPSGSLLAIQGGSFSTGQLDLQDDPSRLVWTSGDLNLTDSDLIIGSGQLLGAWVYLDSTKTLAVSGITTLRPGATIVVDGTQFASGQIKVNGDMSGSGAFFEVLNPGTAQTESLVLGELVGESGSSYVAGELSVSETITVGDDGQGDVVLDGFAGSAVIDNDHVATSATYVAAQAGSSGHISISGPAAVYKTHAMYIGGTAEVGGGDGLVDVQSGGTLQVALPIVVRGASSSLNVFAGSLRAPSIELQNSATFFWGSGTLELTSSDLTIGATGLLGSALVVDATRQLTISGITAVETGNTLGITGGSFSTGSLTLVDGPGCFSWTSGSLHLTNSSLMVGSGQLLGSSISLGLDRQLSISGQTTLQAGSTINIWGGSFSTGSIDASANPTGINWSSGALGLTNSGLTVGSSGLLGSWIDVNWDRALNVSGTTTIESGSWVNVSGGTFSSGQLVVQPGGAFNWAWGTVNLTGTTPFAISPTGPLGSYVYVSSSMALGLRPTTTVEGGSSLTVDGGAVTLGLVTTPGDPSTLRLNPGGRLNVDGSVVVGMPTGYVPDGVLRVENDGTLELTGGTLRLASFSSLELAPSASFDWSSGTLEINQLPLVVGDGTTLFDPILTYENGRHLLTLDAGHRLRLTASAGPFQVGQLATGEVRISEGGYLSCGTSLLAWNGSVSVEGSGSRWISGPLEVDGQLSIRDGGYVSSPWGDIDDENGLGFAEVTGVGSQWYVASMLELHGGRLQVRDGASVRSLTATIEPGIRQTSWYGTLVTGEGSRWDIVNALDLDGSLSIGPGGVVDVSGGSATLGPQGVIEFAGGLLIADAFNHAGGLIIPTDPASALRINSLVSNSYGIDVNLQIGHPGGAGVGAITLDSESLYLSGELVVGHSANATVTVDNGSSLTTAVTSVGPTTAGSGTMLIDNNSSWLNSNQLSVGTAGSGTLTVGTEAFLQTLELFVGPDEAGQGLVTVDGGTLDVVTRLNVGGDYAENDLGGIGELNVQGGAVLTTHGAVIGREAGSTGTVNVTGSSWINSSTLEEETWLVVGLDGAGQLNINAGGSVTSFFTSVGRTLAHSRPNADGTINIDGNGATLHSDALLLGGGHGHVNISHEGTAEVGQLNVYANGTLLTELGGLLSTSQADIDTGFLAGTTSTVTIAAAAGSASGTVSRWINSGSLDVASQQTGAVIVSVEEGQLGSAMVQTGRTSIGLVPGASGSITVDGDSASLLITGALAVGGDAEFAPGSGDGGTGLLRVSNGGFVQRSGGPPWLAVGRDGGHGTLIVEDTGSYLTSTGTFAIGAWGGTGDLQILDGGAVSTASGYISYAASEYGVSGSGSVLVDDGIWNVSSTLYVGDDGGAEFDILNGGAVTSSGGVISSFNSTAEVTIGGASSLWDTGTGSLGVYDHGRLDVNAGGQLRSISGWVDGVGAAVNVGGANATLLHANDLTVGSVSEAILGITAGAVVTDTNGYIARNGGGAQASVNGVGALWSNTGSLYVGGNESSAGGAGTLTVGSAGGGPGTVAVGDTLKIWNTGRLVLDGGIINTGRLGRVEGPFTWNSGALNITNSSFEFVVGATGPLGANVLVANGGRMTVAGPVTVDPGAVLNAYDFVGYNRVVNQGSIISGGDITLGSTSTYQAYQGAGQLVVGSNDVTLNSLGFLNVDFPIALNGGVLSAPNGLLLEPGYYLQAAGQIDARLAIALGTTVTATGDLALGRSDAIDGIISAGILQAGPHTVTLLDRNEAVLGSLTTLGADGASGNLVASKGLLVDFGNNLTGFGIVDTPLNAATPLINNGAIAGKSMAAPITLLGYMKGVGTCDYCDIQGIDAPGFSVAIVNRGSVNYNGTLEIELGGTTAGSGYDQVNHILGVGLADLGGKLSVTLVRDFVPAAGDVFDILTAANVLDRFDSEFLPPLPDNLSWWIDYRTDAVSLAVSLAGDFDHDGDVDGRDFLIWQRGGSPHPLSAADLADWRANYGTSPLIANNSAVPEPVTLWILLMLGSVEARLRRIH